MTESIFSVFGAEPLQRLIRLGGLLGPATLCVAAGVIPTDTLLEFLFFAHERAVVVGCVLVVLGESFDLVRSGWPPNVHKIIKGSAWSVLVVALAVPVMWFTEWIAGARLVHVEVEVPRDGDDVGPFTDVDVRVRHLENTSIYLIVRSPQREFWIQERLVTPKFKEILRGRAALGDGEVGIRQRFEILVVATKEYLPRGRRLEELNPEWVVSNVVQVNRVK